MIPKPWLLLAVVGALVTGCSTQPAFVAAPESLIGVVDDALPADKKAKQQVVIRFLRAIQEGVGDAEQLQLVAPGIRYSGSFTGILQGHARIARWEFDGAPDGNRVAVKLYFDDLQGGPIDPAKLQEARAAFVLSKAGNAWQVADAKS